MTTSHTKEPVNVGKEIAHTLAKLGCKLNEGQQMLLIACSTTWFSELVRQRDFYQQQNAELLDALKEVRRDAVMVRDGRFVDMRTVVEELDAAIAKAGEKQ